MASSDGSLTKRKFGKKRKGTARSSKTGDQSWRWRLERSRLKGAAGQFQISIDSRRVSWRKPNRDTSPFQQAPTVLLPLCTMGFGFGSSGILRLPKMPLETRSSYLLRLLSICISMSSLSAYVVTAEIGIYEVGCFVRARHVASHSGSFSESSDIW